MENLVKALNKGYRIYLSLQPFRGVQITVMKEIRKGYWEDICSLVAIEIATTPELLDRQIGSMLKEIEDAVH